MHLVNQYTFGHPSRISSYCVCTKSHPSTINLPDCKTICVLDESGSVCLTRANLSNDCFLYQIFRLKIEISWLIIRFCESLCAVFLCSVKHRYRKNNKIDYIKRLVFCNGLK